MVRLACAVACCVLAVGTATQAQTVTVTGQAGTHIGDNAALTGAGVYQSNLGGVTYASTISIAPTAINPDTITFRSGNALTGETIAATSFTDVNLALLNRGSSTTSPVLHSEITAAGMGFYMADTRTCGANPQTCPQSRGFATLSDLKGPAGATVLGGASFDFSIVANDRRLYTVHGAMTLNVGADGLAFVTTDIDDAADKLTGFTTLRLGNAGSALGFAWDETTVPALSLAGINPGGLVNVGYLVSVSSFTNGACLSDGFTCLVAYSAFGDPIGRGGDVTNADFRVGGGLNFLGAFGGRLGQNDNGASFINGVVINDTTIDAPKVTLDHLGGPVPEPATWVSMIAGFGLLGAALRRRRVLAYTR